MSARNDSKALIFKTCIAAGVALGMVLLGQTIWSYVYVSQTLITQEAQNDANRKAQSLAATARTLDLTDEVLLKAVVQDRMDDWTGQVAWILVRNAEGARLTEAGTPPEDQPAGRRGGRGGGGGGGGRPPRLDQEGLATSMGRVMIARVPLNRPPGNRGGGPPPEGRGSAQSKSSQPPPPPPSPSVEVAVYVDSISSTFAFLLRYLVVGVSASLALMGSLIFIAVRFNRYVRGQQIEDQLNLARRVQTDMLPVRSKSIGRIDFAADCIPAWDVGGDYCDVFPSGGTSTAVVIGDISGKGISAALLMALIHGAIQSISWTRSAADHEQASRSLNTLLCKKTATERFSSLFWGYFDQDASILRYVNAGHPPPILFRKNGGGEIEMQRLEDGGPVLGLLPEGQYEQGEQRIQTADLLVAFSDGIVEAPNETNEEFGEPRLMDVVKNAWSTSPENIRDAVLAEVRSFVKGSPVADDQTLIVIRFN